MNAFHVEDVWGRCPGLPWGIFQTGSDLPVALFAERWAALEFIPILEAAYSGSRL